jgi:hypothetical protein
MTAAILDNEHKKNSSYCQLDSAAPLNSLSQFVASFDFIDRANKQSELQSLDLSKMCICEIDGGNLFSCSEGKIGKHSHHLR